MEYKVTRQDGTTYIFDTTPFSSSLTMVAISINELYHHHKDLSLENIAKDMSVDMKCDQNELLMVLLLANESRSLGYYIEKAKDPMKSNRVFVPIDLSNVDSLLKLLKEGEGEPKF